MWASAYTIAWCLYQSLLFFAVAYLLWAVVFKSKLITLKAAHQFTLVTSIIIFGTGYFLYLLIPSLLSKQVNSEEVFSIPSLQQNVINIAIVTLYFILVAKNIVVIGINKWCNKGSLVPYTIDAEFKNYLNLFCQHINIKVPVIYWCKKTAVPYTTGLFKKIIVLPMAMVNHFSVAEFEAIILHELAHIKRNDHLWNVVLQFCTVVNSINPFAQLFIKQAIHERELACDDWVLEQEMSPKTYAQTLYKLAAQQQTNAAAQLALAVPQNELLFRIKRLFDNNTISPLVIKWQYLPLLLLGIFITYAPQPTVIKQLTRSEQFKVNINYTINNTATTTVTLVENVAQQKENAICKEPMPQNEVKTLVEQPIQEGLELAMLGSTPITRVSNNENEATLIKSVVQSNFTKVNDAILKVNDSIALFNNNVSAESVAKITDEQLVEMLSILTKDNGIENMSAKSEPAPLKVFQNGMENFYYGNATVAFTADYDAIKNNWTIIYTVKSGKDNLAVRTVEVALTKILQTIDF